MSFVRRLVQRLRRPNYFVGKDLEGNRYFEHPSVLDDPRPKRTVKYSGSGDMWTYVGGSRRLAVQWSSWLTHTRPDPPTLEELHTDLVRQERVRRSVALLTARDQAEDRLRLAEAAATPSSPPAASVSAPIPDPAASPIPLPKAAPKPLPAMPSSTHSADPQPWTPHAAPRGQ